MSTITKERVAGIASGEKCYTHDDVVELARIALASLEAEADYIRYDCGCCGWETLTDWRENDVCPKCNHHPMGKTELFTAPPESVSVPDEDLLHMAASAIEDLLSNNDRSGAGVWADVPAKLRRAAMLHGADGNSPVIPDGWVACNERMPEDARWCAVSTEYGYYVQCWSDGQGWLGDEISIPNCDVTHWMPLPAAPQQEVKS